MVNARVEEQVARLERSGAFDEVAATFHQGEPTYAAVLDRLASRRVTVVPLMAGSGYYTEVVLPRELVRNRRFAEVELRITRPIGLHPRIPHLVRERLTTLVASHGLEAARTSVAVVGHGTRRYRRGAAATFELTRAIGERSPFRAVRAFFLDQSPSVEDALRLRGDLVVFPFLIGGGPHATRDLPARLGLPPDNGSCPSRLHASDDRWVVVDDGLGAMARLPEIILSLARANATRAGC
jgi:sirohydrochlorin cobaltochelatase